MRRVTVNILIDRNLTVIHKVVKDVHDRNLTVQIAVPRNSCNLVYGYVPSLNPTIMSEITKS